MGVKTLWTVLSPICERKSLSELQGKRVAVDLSGWVCESQNVAEYCSQPRMYLRNLYFRTCCLLLLGVHPIFVLEGKAPALKHQTISQRINHRRKQSSSSEEDRPVSSGSRSRLVSLLKQCENMLNMLGLNCVWSEGEAEALCAQLNEAGVVDGIISQDSDCFLYGARTVYRNFTIGPGAGSVDVYHMDDVQQRLSLTRTKLVALSLLCGCDYNDGRGVAGVGKEMALAFFATIKDEDIFTRFRQWRSDPNYEQLEAELTALPNTCSKCAHPGKLMNHNRSGCTDCGLLKGCCLTSNLDHLTQMEPEKRKRVVAELTMRRKALMDPDFPCQATLDEYLLKGPLPTLPEFKWKCPNASAFVSFSGRMLSWEPSYAVEKFLPLIGRWHVLNSGGTLCPRQIIKKRVLRGVSSYEIQWEDPGGLLEGAGSAVLSSIEPQYLVQKTYPALVEDYEEMLLQNKKAKKKNKSKKNSKEETCPDDLLENLDCLKISEEACEFVSANCISKRKILGDLNGRDKQKEAVNCRKKQPVVSVKSLSKKLGQISITNYITVNKSKDSCTSSQEESAQSYSKLTGEEDKAVCKHSEIKTFGSVLEEWDNLTDVDDDVFDISAIIQNIVSG